VSQAALVLEEEVEGREAGLDCQNVDGGTHEAVGGLPLNLVPESGEFPSHMDGGREGVRAIAEDGEKEGGG